MGVTVLLILNILKPMAFLCIFWNDKLCILIKLSLNVDPGKVSIGFWRITQINVD